MQARSISLVDIVIDILLRWRIIVIWMLIGGMLMGGVSYLNSSHLNEIQETQMEDNSGLADEEHLLEQLSWQQENNVQTVLLYEEYSAKRREYMDNSVLMKIEALRVPQIKLTFLIAAADAEKDADIEQIYEDAVSNDLVQWLVENGSSYDSTALSELITLVRSSRGVFAGGSSFCVGIVQTTEEQCNQLAEQVIAYMDIRQNELQELLGFHTIKVANQSFTYVTDIDLMLRQKEVKAEILAYETSIKQLKEEFSEEEWNYYNYIAFGKLPEMSVDTSNTPETISDISPSVSVKYVILGMILFTLVYILYVFMKYIFNNRLHVNDDVKEIYGISQLAFIPSDMSSRKPFGFVDKWILRIRKHSKRIFSREEAVGLAAAAVKIQMAKEELDEVFCIGCVIKEKSMKVAEELQIMLKEEDITMKILDNVLYNQESMEQLQNAKAVFLLEKTGEAFYDEILKELELLHRLEIKVFGAVVVE